MRVQKIKLKVLVSAGLIITFLGLWISGVVIKTILPARTGAWIYFRKGQFLGFNRYQWQEIHGWSFNGFLLLLISHSLLHPEFIKKLWPNLKQTLKGGEIKE